MGAVRAVTEKKYKVPLIPYFILKLYYFSESSTQCGAVRAVTEKKYATSAAPISRLLLPKTSQEKKQKTKRQKSDCDTSAILINSGAVLVTKNVQRMFL